MTARWDPDTAEQAVLDVRECCNRSVDSTSTRLRSKARWAADQLEGAAKEIERLRADLQRESTAVNDQGGGIAHLAGALHEVRRSSDLESARTCAELGLTDLAEWHSGTWTPGPASDPADWRRR